MELNCPGRKHGVPPDSSLRRCANCGKEVEIFADEVCVRCHCGTNVYAEEPPACTKWCPSADLCLGKVTNLDQLHTKLSESERQDAKECVERIGKMISEAKKQRQDHGSTN